MTTQIYYLSLHDALPICSSPNPAMRSAVVRDSSHRAHESWIDPLVHRARKCGPDAVRRAPRAARHAGRRSEEHTSELQSLAYLVCRLLLEKKNAFVAFTA